MQIGSIQSSAQTPWAQVTAPAKTSAFTTYDPADTNEDGVVSPAELLAYRLSHPTVTPSPYTQRGSLQAQASSSSFDLNA
jgi:hypothetical protein